MKTKTLLVLLTRFKLNLKTNSVLGSSLVDEWASNKKVLFSHQVLSIHVVVQVWWCPPLNWDHHHCPQIALFRRRRLNCTPSRSRLGASETWSVTREETIDCTRCRISIYLFLSTSRRFGPLIFVPILLDPRVSILCAWPRCPLCEVLNGHHSSWLRKYLQAGSCLSLWPNGALQWLNVVHRLQWVWALRPQPTTCCKQYHVRWFLWSSTF